VANQGTANPEAGPQMSLLSPAKRDKAVPDVPNSGCLRVGGGGGVSHSAQWFKWIMRAPVCGSLAKRKMAPAGSC
jgi:hypothetical protein